MERPLENLIPPLRYACDRNFARLTTVKDLKGTLERALGSAAGAGVSRQALSGLREALAELDHPAIDRRKAAIVRLIDQLERTGLVDLPSDLKGAAIADPAMRPSPHRRASERPVASRKKAIGAAEARSEQRLLSIAPSRGPLADPLKSLGVRMNPRLLGSLAKRGIRKVGDVLFLLPRCYEDRRRMKPIAELKPGERAVVVGTVIAAQEHRTRAGKKQFRAVIGDSTGTVAAVFFHSGPWLKGKFPIGKKIVLSGELKPGAMGKEIPHPEVEPAEDTESSSIHFNRIVPIYPGFERAEQRSFRELAFRILDQYAKALEEPLPESIRDRLGLLPLSRALKEIHFPPDPSALEPLNRHQSHGHQRLAFDELFFLQLGLSLRRLGHQKAPGVSFNVGPERLAKAKSVLPFELTSAQQRVIKEVASDMGRPEPMSRLLQGDVGSGKTAVALVASGLAALDGYQVAVMAPTEILAEQLYHSFRRALSPLGLEVALYTAAGTPKERRQRRDSLASGKVRVAVGTHALIQEGVEFDRLGLVVIDEQHRFGVLQRHLLMSKGKRPDVLVMTATPIPRTLAMTLYGDLELSVIDELPPGRTPVVTKIANPASRSRVYQAIQGELAKGRQCYVVYPLVEESEKTDLADATRGAEELGERFRPWKVGLLHGRMSSEEKEAVMVAFRDRQLDILVCTTVVEVGLDVPNATVMAIEAAERFGLSQLHQLRGRVGRGSELSYCFLIAGYAKSKESSDRLAVLASSHDGFVIAEKDLELRGPGEFLGVRQSGIPELAVANLVRDGALLALAQREARAVVEADPKLSRLEHKGLVAALEDRWKGRLSLARVG